METLSNRNALGVRLTDVRLVWGNLDRLVRIIYNYPHALRVSQTIAKNEMQVCINPLDVYLASFRAL
jgi:hypothetical protein